MTKKTALMLVLSVFTSIISIAQNQQKIDSLFKVAAISDNDTNLVNTYEKITRLYLRIQLDSAKVYAQKMIDLSETLDYNKGLAMGYNWKGEVFMWQADYPTALNYYRKATNIFAKNGKNILWANSLEIIANTYTMTNNYDSALILYKEALAYHKSKNDTFSAAKVKINIGQVYSRMGDYTTALQYYFQARLVFKPLNNHWFMATERSIAVVYGRQLKYDSSIAIYHRIVEYQEGREDYFRLAESYSNIGVLYEGKKEFDKALEAQKKSKTYREKVNDIYGMAITEMNIGSLYLSINLLDSAFGYLDNSRIVFEKYNALHPLTYNLLLMGNYYLKINRIDKAEKSFLKSSEIALENNLLSSARDASESLIIVYEKKYDYKRALDYAKLFKQQYDSIINEDNIRAQTIAKEEYKQKIQLLEKEEEIKYEKQQKNYAIVLGVIISLSLIILIFYRIKLQKTKLLKLEQDNLLKIKEAGLKIQREERKRVANILHDNLAHVIINSQNQLNTILGKAEILPIKPKLEQISENLEFMNKLAKVASYELEFSFVLEDNLIEQFEKYIARVQHSHSPKITFDHSSKTGFDNIDPEIKINLFSVFQEMLGNAIKYAKAKSIIVSLINDEGKVSLQVDDDGIGFDYKEVRHGQGFPNMRKRAEKLNGKFTFESEPGFGTKLKFEV